MEGEFTKEQIDEFREAFAVFDKGISIYYVGIILDFFWPSPPTVLNVSKTDHLLDPPTQPSLLPDVIYGWSLKMEMVPLLAKSWVR